MAWKLALSLGDSFAEFSARSKGSTPIVSRRYYLPIWSLEKALTDFFKQNQIEQVEEVKVASRLPLKVLKKGLGTSPAFIVTGGFEAWPGMNRPLKSKTPNLYAERMSSPLNSNLIFGITERMNPKGEPVTSPDPSELEFLVSKLKMNEVEHVAVGLLHSQKNPEHEKQVQQFLKEHGFHVFCSYESSISSKENPRWWGAILNAYLSSTFQEFHEELLGAISQHCPLNTEQVKFVRPQEEVKWQNNGRFFETAFGHIKQLQSQESLQKDPSDILLYLGVEEFFIVSVGSKKSSVWESPIGPVAMDLPQFQHCRVQPNQKIGQSFWGTASFLKETIDMEPGPMAFGKGLVPTVIDVFYISGILGSMPAQGLNEVLTQKASPRIAEGLFVLSQGGEEKVSLNGQDVGEALSQQAIHLLALDLLHSAGQGELSVRLGGPLAATVGRKIQEVLKNSQQIQFANQNAEEFESPALLNVENLK